MLNQDFERKRLDILNQLKKVKAAKRGGLYSAFSDESISEESLASSEHPIMAFLCKTEKVREFTIKTASDFCNIKAFEDSDQLYTWMKETTDRYIDILLDIDDLESDKKIIEFCGACKSLKPKLHLYVLSAKLNEKLFLELGQIGVEALLRKPINLNEVKSLLNGEIPPKCKMP